jgi:glycosyltransferase involved in cell wall biosynthesis
MYLHLSVPKNQNFSFRMISIQLIVSPLPPSRCGIGTYAAEQVRALQADGIKTTTLSPLADSDADYHFDVCTLKSSWNWFVFCISKKFDAVHLHYADGYFFSHSCKNPIVRQIARALQILALRLLASRSGHSSLIMHEMPHSPGMNRIFTLSRSLALANFDEFLFHTDSMMNDCLKLYPSLRKKSNMVIEHDRFMRKRYVGDKTKARMDLGINENSIVFLCIGFIQHSKGFDDVVKAFSMIEYSEKMSLHIVGSRLNPLEIERVYAENLAELCNKTMGCQQHSKYISDEQFDCWLAAADVVFLPYRGVVSSGVGARSGLYKTPIVVRSLPNLMDQFPSARHFKDLEQLTTIMREYCSIKAMKEGPHPASL